MYYSRKRYEDIPRELTTIWSCTQDDCIGWIRDNFSFEAEPTCHLCHSPMTRGTKELPVLENSRGDQKSLKKGIAVKKE